MRIWVDADACPRAIKDILFRAAKRVEVVVTLLANSPLSVPSSPFIDFIAVPDGFDEADNQIVQRVEQGDLVITADIPLAAEVVNKGGYALNPRGEFYSEENIHACLSVRNLMHELRDSGVVTGGPPSFKTKNLQAFANQLDRFLTKNVQA